MQDLHMPYTEAEIPEGRNCVCIHEIKRSEFVVFEYVAGDPTLFVELVLPFLAFCEFCSVNDVLILPPNNEQAGLDYDALCIANNRRPGRPVADVLLFEPRS